MGVVAAQIVEDHRDRGGFRVQAQLKVARVVGGPSILPRDEAMIADGVPGQRLLIDVAGGGTVIGPPVLSCHVHCLGVNQHSFDFTFLFLECFRWHVAGMGRWRWAGVGR